MHCRSGAQALLSLFVLVLPFDLCADNQLFTTDGYRIARYRAASPDTPPAGRRVDTAELVDLIRREKPLLIDVQAITLRPETEEFGISWLPSRERRHIPASTWLPNVGYGQLEPRMLFYLKSNLERLTDGDRSRPLVFYCVVDCWMSWNAIKRADELGYRNLHWYPEGSDGWGEAGLELVLAQPVPLQGMTDSGHCGTVSETKFFKCWTNDLKTLMSRVREDPALKGILLFFETEHCPFCLRMRRGVLTDADLIDYFRKRFISVTLDLESDAPLIAPDGSETTEMAYARSVHRVVRTPTMIFLGTDGEEVHRHTGIVVDHRVLRALADYVAGRYYEQIGFREFLTRS